MKNKHGMVTDLRAFRVVQIPTHYFPKRHWRQVLLNVLAILFAVAASPAQQNPYDFKIGHPRIIMTKYDELALRFTMMEDPLAEKLMAELKKDADKLLSGKNIKYSLDRQNTMQEISREYFKRVLTLSLAYRIFENDKYSDKAIEIMMYACTYPDWNPNHFPDVAEMTAALAIGYDWNFYHLNIREKETIRNKILEYGLSPGLAVYTNPDDKPHVWYKMNNNWNQVCSGGLILGALAVGEDFPDIKNNLIYQAVKNLMPTLELYEPDGVWFEGPAYWGYANTYLAMAISGLNSALEHDFGLSERPGIDKTADFYVSSVSPTGEIFNYGDAESAQSSLEPALFWFSKRYTLSKVASYYKQLLKNNLSPASTDYGKGRNRFFYLSLPWFDESVEVSVNNPKAQYFRGEIDLLFLQSLKGDKDALYLATKGGKGTLSHQQLDAGTFVIDANGERWGMDLGSENYFLPGFFDNEVDGERWTYYRNINKSHSSLVVGEGIQNPAGLSKITEVNLEANQPFGIVDLSDVYDHTKRVFRGYKLLSDDQILIRDEILLDNDQNTVRWAMMTDAEVEIFADKVVLTKNGKKFFIQAFTDEDVEFMTEPAKAFHKETKDNTGKRLVYLLLNKSGLSDMAEVSVVMGKNLDGVNQTLIKTKLSSW